MNKTDLLNYLNERIAWLSRFSVFDYAIRELEMLRERLIAEPDEISIYNQREIHENCTVEILTNTETGDVSVGWWENKG